MKFLTITLKGIRNFEEKTIHFQDGLNIVCGPNESGKTTLLDSLLFCITGDKRDTPDLKRWNADHSSINLQYETEPTQTYMVTRTLYPEEKVRLENAVIMEDPETVSATLDEHFGTTNKIVIENSSVVKHNEMEILRKMDSKRIIKEQMQVALSGSVERSTEDVIRILEGSITQSEASLRGLQYKIDDVKRRLTPYEGIDEQYTKFDDKIRVYQDDLKDYQKKYEAHTSRILYGELTTDIKEARKRLEHVEDIESYTAALPFEEIKEAETLQEKLREKEEAIENLNILIEERKKELGEDQRGGILTWVKSLFGKNKIDPESRRHVLENLIKNNEEEKYKIEVEISEIKARMNYLTNQIGIYKGKDLEYLIQIKKRNQEKIEELLQGLSKEELAASLHKKQEEADMVRSAVFRTYPELLEEEDQQIHHDKELLGGKIEIVQKEIEDAQQKLRDVMTRIQERDRIKRELHVLTTQKEELTTKKEVDLITVDMIQSVYTDLKNLFIPQLEEKTGRILHKITRGKYQRVSIRREDLEISVEIPDRTLDIPSLSQGTKDQLYFSLRIALSNLLSGGRNLPLLFDESFYTSDEKRLKETVAVLQEIAKSTQVIVFTHNEDFLQYGTSIMLTPEREFHQLY